MSDMRLPVGGHVMKAAIDGERLRQWLDAAGLTQAELARLLNVDAAQVSRWCTGRAPLRGEYVDRLIELLAERDVQVELPRGTRVFLSTPMAALDNANYEEDRLAATGVYEHLCQIAAPVYWPAAQIASTAGFEAPDLATERNLRALMEAEAFVFLQLRELAHPTSCHVELGMAIAWQMPVTIFAADEGSLPYTLQRFSAIAGRVGMGGRYRFYSISSSADAVRLLGIHGAELIGVAQRPDRILEKQS